MVIKKQTKYKNLKLNLSEKIVYLAINPYLHKGIF
jgi:hypothetical protein